MLMAAQRTKSTAPRPPSLADKDFEVVDVTSFQEALPANDEPKD
jgi:hypothetical protein